MEPHPFAFETIGREIGGYIRVVLVAFGSWGFLMVDLFAATNLNDA